MPVTLSDESRYRILRLIEQNLAISQREIARELGISLGKANFCLNALIEKGVLKANAFLNNRNKRAYAYLFTPSGIESHPGMLQLPRFPFQRLNHGRGIRASPSASPRR